MPSNLIWLPMGATEDRNEGEKEQGKTRIEDVVSNLY